MTKLDEVQAAIKYLGVHGIIDGNHDNGFPTKEFEDVYETITNSLFLYQAILEKRVLLVPVEPDLELWDAGTNELLFGKNPFYSMIEKRGAVNVYKAMTQAVNVNKLIEEITK